MVSPQDSLQETIDREALLFVGIMFENMPFLTVHHLSSQAKHCQEAGGLSHACPWRSVAKAGQGAGAHDGRVLEPPLSASR